MYSYIVIKIYKIYINIIDDQYKLKINYIVNNLLTPLNLFHFFLTSKIRDKFCQL